MKQTITEESFDFVGKKGPYLLGVKLPEIENEWSINEWSIITVDGVINYIRGKASKLMDFLSHDHQWDHVPHSH